MAGVRLEFAQFGDFDSFDILRSDTPMDINALPSPIVTGLPTMFYVDTAVVEGATYYYRVVAWRDGISRVSDEINIMAANDLYWPNVISLLHFDGNLNNEAGGNTFYFNGASSFESGISGDGINPRGNYTKRVQCDLASPVTLFDGSDYTVECFFKRTGNPSNNGIIFIISNNVSAVNSGSKRLALYQLTNNTVAIEYGDGADSFNGSYTFPLDTFVHLALCRSAGTLMLFADGQIIHTVNNPPIYTTGLTEITIGGMRDVITGDARERTAHGVIDEFRLTVGIARYTTNFTPPDVPFPSS